MGLRLLLRGYKQLLSANDSCRRCAFSGDDVLVRVADVHQ